MIYTDNSLAIYLQLIKNIPLLNRKEEKKIVSKVKKGNLKAKQKLVISNLKFVVQIAKRYRNSNISLIDLVSEGNMGLMKATENFDPNRGVNFISYAVHWIKQSILKAIAEKSNIIRIPLNWNNNLAKIYKKKIEFKNQFNDKNISKIAKELNINTKQVNQLIKIFKPHLSISQKINVNDDKNKENQIENILSDKNSLEENFLKETLKNDIDFILDELKAIEADIIRLRFGLNNNEVHTLLEIGKKYNLSKERIRQIEKNTLAILKKKMKKKSINSYLTV